MAIFEPIQIEEGGNTFKRLTRSNRFWAVGYDDGKVIREMTEYDADSPPEYGGRPANSVTDGPVILNGFGADTYQELLEEIQNRGLTYPE